MQIAVFAALLGLIAGLTWWFCRGEGDRGDGETAEKDYFLAGGGLSWIFVAGSITLTNLSTDQLVGMNGNQMALLAWWELSAVVGLSILALVFIPIYYKYNCTTTTELLERRYNDKHIRALISALFLFGNLFIFLPTVLYSGALFMREMFPELELGWYPIAVTFAVLGAAFSVLGGLKAVAVSDTFAGVLVLGMAIAVTVLALNAVGFDLSGVPAERLTLIGDADSPIPFATLFTGMIFIQMFYWSTNQVITQRAMASPSVGEAQKGIFAAAAIRFLIIPAIVVVPGIVSFKLYGRVEGDAAYGRIASDLLPPWAAGAFAAAITMAVLSTFNSILNSSVALYVCDLHERYVNEHPPVRRLSLIVSVVMVVVALIVVPIYARAESIINTIQTLFGLLSMPILSVFIVGLVFAGVKARAAMVGTVWGVGFYFWTSDAWGTLTRGSGRPVADLHYIHWMAVTLITSVALTLILNAAMGGRASLSWGQMEVDSSALPAE